MPAMIFFFAISFPLNLLTFCLCSYHPSRLIILNKNISQVIESVVTINPGTISKRRGPGTYARITVLPPSIPKKNNGDDDQMDTSVAGEMFGHRLYERARVDIVRV